MPAASLASTTDNDTIKGLVQSISDKEIVIKDTVIALSSGTVVLNGSLADLAIGAPVELKIAQDEKGLYAVWIACNDDKVEIEGFITALTDETITVGDTTFLLTSTTKIKYGIHSDLRIGIKVEIYGQKDGDDLIAIAIEILWGDYDNDSLGKAQHIKGKITAIRWVGDEAYITLDGKLTLHATEEQKVLGRHGIYADATCLFEGLKLFVRYREYVTAPDTSGSGVAEKIVVIDKASVAGVISTVTEACVDLPSIYVDGNLVYHDKFTRVIGPTGDPKELSDGTEVKVLCNAVDDGSYLSNKIIVHGYNDDGPGGLVKTKGEVTAVTREGGVITGFSVDEQAFVVDENTQFKVYGYAGPLPEDEFVVGLTVYVKAMADEDNNLVVNWVKAILPTSVYCGEITEIGDSVFTLLSQTITVTEWTKFDDFEAEGFGFDDLIIGDKVKVKTVLFPSGLLIAAEIEPCDGLSTVVIGTIESIEATAGGLLLSVSGVTVKTTAETVIKKKVTATTSAELEVGDSVFVKGVLDEFGVLVAEYIKVK